MPTNRADVGRQAGRIPRPPLDQGGGDRDRSVSPPSGTKMGHPRSTARRGRDQRTPTVRPCHRDGHLMCRRQPSNRRREVGRAAVRSGIRQTLPIRDNRAIADRARTALLCDLRPLGGVQQPQAPGEIDLPIPNQRPVQRPTRRQPGPRRSGSVRTQVGPPLAMSARANREPSPRAGIPGVAVPAAVRPVPVRYAVIRMVVTPGTEVGRHVAGKPPGVAGRRPVAVSLSEAGAHRSRSADAVGGAPF
jgi:hypothetical protein